ncbi:hypothetical protein SERLA73DRAFT_73673 [Serpula lacrymans var. lacrymans S7.3]|uniref:DSBA-like thioredoxin domain-containing protein n=2 Tax=Serpula lacrymans var. lacrymans TaxID=341189 RepID=F8PZ01_SERL3|nr:uncharacterized protein SERLADRAFT_468354 [Serpula lacrymans var. lacrymans S7.9]EGN99114.1 hypothetical protein SERLA73DRAFT_73673 [Serpula lacrymans var. lacrymans S7.3]EGO24683.1 hypothetical protein SERLADRAFT_468354 [Serpula lacrymans var. lacrymans S7.9]
MTSPPPHPQRLIKIIVISDYICAFCYIGNKELRDAIEQCSDLPVKFDVEFRPFTLVHCPEGKPIPRKAYLEKKFGPEQADMSWKVVGSMAQAAGLKIKDEGLMCQSANAHRLSVKAYQTGGQEMQQKVVATLFEASFVESQDLSNLDILADLAAKAELMDREQAVEFLQSDECKEDVEKMIAAAKANGVIGVPFIIINGKWALNGVQSTQCYIQIFRKLAKCTELCCTHSSPTVPSAAPGKLLQKVAAPSAVVDTAES